MCLNNVAQHVEVGKNFELTRIAEFIQLSRICNETMNISYQMCLNNVAQHC